MKHRNFGDLIKIVKIYIKLIRIIIKSKSKLFFYLIFIKLALFSLSLSFYVLIFLVKKYSVAQFNFINSIWVDLVAAACTVDLACIVGLAWAAASLVGPS